MQLRSRQVRAGAVAALATVGLAAGSLASTATADQGRDAQRTYTAKAAADKYVKLDLLALNDFHGQLEVVPSSSSSGRINNTPAGGAAYLAALLKEERAKSRAAGATPITVAAGDLIGASPLLSAAFHDEPTIEAMNKIGLQVASVGNHEFDEGWRELKRMQNGGCLDDGDGENGADSCPGGKDFDGADFRYLGANVVWKDQTDRRRRTVFPGVKVMDVEGEKVAFIGMTLEATDTIVSPSGIEEIDFEDEVETANALVPRLREQGIKSMVVLLHEGVQPTDATAYNDCTGVSGPGPGHRRGPQARDRRRGQRPHPPALQLRGRGPQRQPAAAHQRVVAGSDGLQAALPDRPEVRGHRAAGRLRREHDRRER